MARPVTILNAGEAVAIGHLAEDGTYSEVHVHASLHSVNVGCARGRVTTSGVLHEASGGAG